MSNGLQSFKPRCQPCCNRDRVRYLIGSIPTITWWNIVVIRKAGESFILKCLRCGHTYRSSSRAAYTLYEKEGIQEAKP